MLKKIEKPKVFISYAWGTEEYQEKVMSLCNQLVQDGIDVILDKWDMQEGNDTFAFMEQCVKDESITNVLILLDSIYAKKANDYKGGVGTETQIISPEVYKEVKQTKFLPIVFERSEEGEICKPVYLKSKLHFDLTVQDKYEYEYMRLVRTLYGEPTYAKPEVGNKPKWVDDKENVSHRDIIKYQSIKNESVKNGGSNDLRKYLLELKNKIIEFSNKQSESIIEGEGLLELYDVVSIYKSDFLLIIKNSDYVEKRNSNIADFFEDTFNDLPLNSSVGKDIARVLLHELFLYTVAYFIRNKEYESIGYILSRSYYNRLETKIDKGIEDFAIFYTTHERSGLYKIMCVLNDKNYYCGTAQYWIDNIESDFCSKDEFILADLICFNYSMYGKHYSDSWKWFPLTYIYDNEFNGVIRKYGRKLISKEWCLEMMKIFSYSSIEEFKEKFKKLEKDPNIGKDYRYGSSFKGADMLGYFISSEEIATKN